MRKLRKLKFKSLILLRRFAEDIFPHTPCANFRALGARKVRFSGGQS